MPLEIQRNLRPVPSVSKDKPAAPAAQSDRHAPLPVATRGVSKPSLRQRDTAARARLNLAPELLRTQALRAVLQSSPGLSAWIGNSHALPKEYQTVSSPAALRKNSLSSARYALAKKLCETCTEWVAGIEEKKLFGEIEKDAWGTMLGVLGPLQQKRVIDAAKGIGNSAEMVHVLDGLITGIKHLKPELQSMLIHTAKDIEKNFGIDSVLIAITKQYADLSPGPKSDLVLATQGIETEARKFSVLEALVKQSPHLTPGHKAILAKTAQGLSKPDDHKCIQQALKHEAKPGDTAKVNPHRGPNPLAQQALSTQIEQLRSEIDAVKAIDDEFMKSFALVSLAQRVGPASPKLLEVLLDEAKGLTEGPLKTNALLAIVNQVQKIGVF
jgi:hypothetical protein